MNKERLLLIAILFICFSFGIYNIFHKEYSYIDMNDNKGISKRCYMNDKGLFCDTNGQIIEVKQYGLK